MKAWRDLNVSPKDVLLESLIASWSVHSAKPALCQNVLWLEDLLGHECAQSELSQPFLAYSSPSVSSHDSPATEPHLDLLLPVFPKHVCLQKAHPLPAVCLRGPNTSPPEPLPCPPRYLQQLGTLSPGSRRGGTVRSTVTTAPSAATSVAE